MSSVDGALDPLMALYRQFYESTPAMLHSIGMNGVLVTVCTGPAMSLARVVMAY